MGAACTYLATSKRAFPGARVPRAAMAHEHAVWIERFAARLGVPVRAAIVALAVGTFLLFLLTRVLAGAPAVAAVALSDVLLFVLLVFPLAIPVYVRRLIVSLEAHALSMVKDPKAVREKLAALGRLGPVAVLTVAIFLSFVLPIIASGPPGPLLTAELLLLVPLAVAIWITATALWTLGYSLAAIYRMGRLPLALQPFALDRALGLRPFATASLRLGGVYYLLSVLLILPDLLSPSTPASVFVQDFALVLFGLPLFLLPLLSLRGKLVRARAEKMAWVNAWFHRLVQRVEANGEGDLPPGLQNELLSLDKVQREVQAIRTWPFDVGIVARFVTILLSVTAILLAAVIRSLLRI